MELFAQNVAEKQPDKCRACHLYYKNYTDFWTAFDFVLRLNCVFGDNDFKSGKNTC